MGEFRSLLIEIFGSVLNSVLVSIFLTAAIGFIAKISSAAAVKIINSIRCWYSLVEKHNTFILSSGYFPFDLSKVKAHYLFVRYGTDNYIQKLASDSERYEGRLRNEVKPVEILTNGQGKTELRFSIKVHKRLGVQFKCFFEVVEDQDENTKQEVKNFLDKCAGEGTISDPTWSCSFLHKNRIFFILRGENGEEIACTTTVDGQENNMCYPE